MEMQKFFNNILLNKNQHKQIMKLSELQKEVNDFKESIKDNSKNQITAEHFRKEFLNIRDEFIKTNNK